jgi:hypothetical protein
MTHSAPRIRTEQLRRLDRVAWSALLRQHTGQPGLAVTSVRAGKRTSQRVAYRLTLAGHTDPVVLQGESVSLREAQFYHDLAPTLPAIAPPCLFSYRSSDESWVVLDELPPTVPPAEWSADMVLKIVSALAAMHATHWDNAPLLRQYPWLEGGTPVAPVTSAEPHLSHQADRHVGALAPLWREAQAGVTALLALEGWHGVLEERHLRAAADLLDDPLPMLHPLSQLPQTVLHGYPGIYNWRINPALESYCLTGWHQVARGAGVCDLITFVETFGLLLDDDNVYHLRERWPVTEQTITDHYILELAVRLGAAAETTALRRALPAARCLHVLLNWFPRFHKWVGQLPDDDEGRKLLWQLISTGNPDDPDAPAVFRPIQGLRPFLAETFRRFIQAYHQLA